MPTYSCREHRFGLDRDADGKTIPRGTWDSWVADHRITAAGHDSTGVALFRFSDVRDLAAEWVAKPRK